MNKTFGEIIDEIISRAGNATGRVAQESKISEVGVLKMLLDTRSQLVREKWYKGRQFSIFDYQTISCIELVPASLSENPMVPQGKFLVRKTVHPLPKPMFGRFDVVTTVQGNETLDPIAWENVSNFEGGRFDFSMLKGYTEQNVDGKIWVYVINATQTGAIAVKMLAEDPMDIIRFPVCGSKAPNKCLEIREQEFPLDRDLLNICKDIVISKLMDPRARETRPDIIQDNNDNTVVPKSNIK